MDPYELAGSACEPLVVSKRARRVLDLGATFPEQAKMKGVAHVGAAVRRGEGEVLGVLCALGEPEIVISVDAGIFEMFAERAAAEVERARADAEFRAHTEARLRHQSALL